MKSKRFRLLMIAMLVVVMSFTLVGCGGDSGNTSSGNTSNGASTGGQAVEPEHVWTVTSAWVAGFRFNEYVEKHMEMIEKYSDGRIKINLYTGNELVPSMETWDAVESGLVDAAHM
ncbi:type 2 periplasmic-binding domain-containing protein [Candidatus Contubernalis alkaliaceticus]|uniref:hypothetical protein n=1 Tax=Candidatus Contubernalis alkaliaceticus TaxID=338645 RepID=UPI001F4C05AD|nr:hypothetical protein [Candidatus Contubernalis alkalaceticus]UNC92935.1 hypothetical protein HUE98_13000 [Candidatus Contubernalis alkalaceticus]